MLINKASKEKITFHSAMIVCSIQRASKVTNDTNIAEYTNSSQLIVCPYGLLSPYRNKVLGKKNKVMDRWRDIERHYWSEV